MSTIAEIHDAGLNLFQSLIPKSMTLTFPSTTINNILKNKKFKITQISASGLSNDRIAKQEDNYSNETVILTILNSVLENTKDTTNTVNCPLYGFKENNVIITYKRKNYSIKEELLNEFDSSISLICDAKA